MAQGKLPAFNVTLYSDSDGSQITDDYAAALAIECQVQSKSRIPAQPAPAVATPRRRVATWRQVFLCAAIQFLSAPLASRLSDSEMSSELTASPCGEGDASEGRGPTRQG